MSNKTSETKTVDRRRFVLAGAGAAAAAAGPLLSPRRAWGASALALKVGVMAPTGGPNTALGASLLDGLVLGFEEARSASVPVDATLVSRQVERGFAGAATYAQELLDAGCEVVVGGVSALAAARLGALFAERRTSLVVADVGAHVVPPSQRNAYVLHSSLLYWHASHAFGRWAPSRMGSRALVAVAAPDAGYDTVYAFRRGFEVAGGTVVAEIVPDAAADGFAELRRAVASARPNLVYALYTGPEAAELVRVWAGWRTTRKLAFGALGVDDFALASIGSSAVGIRSCASWTASSSTRTNQEFVAAFKSRYGRAPDPFAVVGYDTARLVAEGARRATESGIGVRRLVEALAGASLASPRGTLTVDTATNTVVGPLAIREVRSRLGTLSNEVIAPAPSVDAFPDAMSALSAGSPSGYLNEYLFA
jgi:branched-chain amino acid transport system substrate-binding protein